jgi:hypothetical protein
MILGCDSGSLTGKLFGISVAIGTASDCLPEML